MDKCPSRKKRKETRIKKSLQLKKLGMKNIEIAKELNLNRQTIGNYFNANNI